MEGEKCEHSLVTQTKKAPPSKLDGRAIIYWRSIAEDEGLEPPRACARRISSAVPYQLGLVLQGVGGHGPLYEISRHSAEEIGTSSD